jgi:predicted dienelactone hydrolase
VKEAMQSKTQRQTWQRSRSTFLAKIALSCGILASSLFGQHFTATPAFSAQKISFWYPPFGEFTIPITELAKFAQDGTVSEGLSFYLDRMPPEQKADFRQFLNQRFPLSHVTISQFTYSPIGQILVRRLGTFLKTDDFQNGFYALRAALILSAADAEGLTPINMLKKFPVNIIRLDLPLGLQAYSEISQLLDKKDDAIAAIEQEAEKVAATNPFSIATVSGTSTASTLPDLRQQGEFKWRVRNFSFVHPERKLTVPAQIYLPLDITTPVPVIVISHGAASNPDTFAYLSKHLTSHGFAVATLEHPGTGTKDVRAFLTGFQSAPNSNDMIYRPLDIKYLLDDLERQVKIDPSIRIDLQNVGIIGQSLGGYTALALSGAELNFAEIQRVCGQPEPNVLSFNISILLQCQVTNLSVANYTLSDRRIKAVLAVNPFTSTMFGKQGMSQIQIPIMIVSSGDDVFTPAIPEQVFPFIWLTAPTKYLVLVKQGTHFSFLANGNEGDLVTLPQGLIGPDPNISQSYLKAIGLAFFKAHLDNQSQFRPYLSSGYVKTISNSAIPISLVNAFSEESLLQAIDRRR